MSKVALAVLILVFVIVGSAVIAEDPDHPPVVERVFPEHDSTFFKHHQPFSIEYLVEVSDPDGDLISYTWSVDGEMVAQGPENTYEYWGEYSEGVSHDISINVVATDGWLSVEHNWTIHLLNRPPVVESYSPSIEAIWVDLSDKVVFRVAVKDEDGDEVTYSWTVQGAGVPDANDEEFEFEAAIHGVGQYNVTVRATDVSGDSANHSWIVHVKAPSEPPTDGGDGLGITTMLVAVAVLATLSVLFLFSRIYGKG